MDAHICFSLGCGHHTHIALVVFSTVTMAGSHVRDCRYLNGDSGFAGFWLWPDLEGGAPLFLFGRDSSEFQYNVILVAQAWQSVAATAGETTSAMGA